MLRPLFQSCPSVRQLWSSAGVAALVSAFALPTGAQSLESYIDYSAENLPGRLYVPPAGVDPEALRPMVIALHGGGGIGNNNIGNVWDFEDLLTAAKSHGAFIYAPQAMSAFWGAQNRPAAIMAQLDRAIETYGIDPNRITLTGFSMGGGGTWHIGALYSDRFAAILPVCGIVPRAPYEAENLLGKPIKVFHARNDPSVRVSDSRTRINELLRLANHADIQPPALTAAGDFLFIQDSLNLSYTEWETGGHAIWNRVYQSQEVTDWLFSRSLVATEPEGRITLHPQSATFPLGASLELVVTTAGIDSPSYQWTRNNIPLAGATNDIYRVESLTLEDAGLFRVEITDGDRKLIGGPALVQVAEPQQSQLTNLSVRGHIASTENPLIVGFVASGNPSERLFRAIGPTLSDHGIFDALPDPQIQLHSQANGEVTVVAENQDWGGDARVAQLTVEAGAFPFAQSSSRDAAFTWTGTGAFTAHVSDEANQSGTVLVELYAADMAEDHSLINVSARQSLSSPDDVLIAGFVLDGNIPKQMLIRAIGPSLARFGVDAPMTNPRLQLFRHEASEGVLFAENTTWIHESNADQMNAAVPGAFTIDEEEKDAAVLLNVPTGIYTVHASSADQGTGDVLIEVYVVPASDLLSN